MRRTTIALMAVALAAAPFAGGASAEQYGTKDESAAAGSREAGATEVMRSDDIIGSEVRDATGEEIGSVDSLMIGPDGKVHSAILSLGGVLGVGDKKVEVPWDSLQVKRQADDPDELTVTASRKALESAPEYEEPGLMGSAARDTTGGMGERDERSARMPAAGAADQ